MDPVQPETETVKLRNTMLGMTGTCPPGLGEQVAVGGGCTEGIAGETPKGPAREARPISKQQEMVQGPLLRGEGSEQGWKQGAM